MLLLLFSLSGCGIIDWFYLPPPEDTAQELYEAGNDAMREKKYSSAAEYYTKLRDNFPFSPYVVDAELSLADCFYLSDEWIPASDAYKEFELMHPRHEAMPYVLYQIGMSNLKSYTSIDRAPTEVEEAYSYFARLREMYEGDEYASRASAQMQECRRLLAEHELYVGDFYFRTGRYGAAWSRYKVLADNFEDVPEIHAHAVEKAKSAYLLRGQAETEETRREVEKTWHRWFRWL